MKRKVDRNQIVSSILASSILLQSCGTVDWFYDDDIKSINENNQIDQNSIFIDLRIDPKDKEYFEFINKLSLDIINNPSIAEKFAKDPSSYTKKLGYADLKINVEDDLLKLILILGDPEINKAIHKNDIESFISLCKEKKLIKEFDMSDIEKVKKVFDQNPELLELLYSDDAKVASAVAFVVAVAVGAVVAVWAVVASHAVLVNAVGGGTVFVAAAAGTWIWNTWGKPEVAQEKSQRNNHIYQAWNLKGGDISKTYILLSELEDQQLSDFIRTLKKEFPNDFENVNIDNLKQVIARSLKLTYNQQ